MTSGRGEWVRALFAANARDWTPPSVADAACALFAPISYDPEASRRWAAVLSHSEVQMAGRLVTEAARAQFEQRRAFQRYCAAVALGSRRPLSEIVFRQTAKGRAYLPDLPELWFSFSSCRRGFLGAWSWTLGVGVDLEDRTRLLDASAVAQHLFPEAEAKAVSSADGEERLRTFFQLWTLKEAALKSIGEGLAMGLDAFEFRLPPVPRVVRAPCSHGGPEQFRVYVVERACCCAAVVIRRNEPDRAGATKSRLGACRKTC